MQKSRAKWLRGDNNTAFFDIFSNGRKRKNSISSLQIEGEENSDRETLEKDIVNTFIKFTPKIP